MNCYFRAPKFNNCPRNTWIVIIFSMCIQYKFVNCMLKGIWWQMKFGEIFWGDVKIDVSKGGGGCKQKGNDYTILSPSNSSSNKWLLPGKINIPMFNFIISRIYLFNTFIISYTLFSAYSNGFLTYICRRVPQWEII